MPYVPKHKIINEMKQCIKCEKIKSLSDFTFTTSNHRWYKGKCNGCRSAETISRFHTKGISKSYTESKKCSSYLGVHIAERLLSTVFKVVSKLPYGNKGFDFVCNNGYKIDSKSACLDCKRNRWLFHIRYNTTADYFACIAFDNRTDLNPKHFWLIPSNIVNKRDTLIIYVNSKKWDLYEKPLDKLIIGCGLLKGGECDPD